MNRISLRFSIKNFRAIKEASITLNGITVVAGENGSGKSTISRLLYYTFKAIHNFNSLIEAEIKEKLKKIVHYLAILEEETETFMEEQTSPYNEPFTKLLPLLKATDEEPSIEFLKQVINSLKSFYGQLKIDKDEQFRLERLKLVLIAAISDEFGESNEWNSYNIEQLLDKVREYVVSLEKRIEKWKNERPLELFEKYLKSRFDESITLQQIELLEHGVPIIDPEKKRLRLIHSMRNPIYIDTPMSIGAKGSGKSFKHWEDLNRLLTHPADETEKIPAEIRSFFEKETIRGQVYYEKDPLKTKNFVYRRDDGLEFDLLECATGIKSFGIIQMLYYNGHLKKDTLLIIDEPEAHLHPQWIVEYARMMVMLNKLVGVKFFVATHNPDMVSAIRYISEKEGILDRVSFYLAKKGKRYLYSYRHLKDIDPIFASYNIALERISKYGFSEENQGKEEQKIR